MIEISKRARCLLPALLLPWQPGAAAAQPSPFLAADGTTSFSAQQAERVADLLRLWNEVRLFHIDPRASGPEWEAALEAAAEDGFAANDDAELAKVAAMMLGRIQSASVPTSDRPVAAKAAVPAARLESGRVVVSCPGLADTIKKQGETGWTPAITASMKRYGLIFDCRGFASGYAGFEQSHIFRSWLRDNAPGLLSRPVAGGAIRMRFHDGYPPDVANTSGGYVGGTVDRALTGSKATGQRTAPMVFVADGTTPDLWELVGPLQTEAGAKLVMQGTAADPGLSRFRARHLTIMVKTAEFVGANGRLGLRPDACVAPSASGSALVIARSLLAGGKGAGCRSQAAAIPTAVPAATVDTKAVPTLGTRMVALAKLWGTFEYFFPYKNLADKSWSDALEEFVPIFARAETQTSYKDAVLRLAARSQDSHVGLRGGMPTRLSGAYAPPVYVRPVQSGFAVAALHDAALAGRLRPGDRILAVDGKPVEQIADDLREVTAASTDQSFASKVATMLTAGANGTDVRLTIRRGEAPPMDVSVKRSMLFGLAGQKPKTATPSFNRLAGGDIGYVDLVRLTSGDADRAIDALMDAKAIIFDLRGYPQGTAWVLAPRLALDGRQGAIAAQFRRPIYTGPSEPQQNWNSFTQAIPTGDKPRYGGRVIVLIDERAVSQSEHSAMFFEAANKPIFVGTPTTGANGDVTDILLPGGLNIRFTGHDVRHADGRQLQRVGIKPDILVAPTFAGMLSGRDEVLEAGVEAARKP